MGDLQSERQRMVDEQLARRGITDPRVLEAFATVPRERFVPPELVEHAYEDHPLAIGEGQTISQPYIVARTIQGLGLRGHERVLEVGTGSGYAAALLSHLAREVYTIERIDTLAQTARERFAELGYPNVHTLVGDGSLGWPEHAPFDAIAVAASGPRAPLALRDQLAIGGRLVMPIGPSDEGQTLTRIVREDATTFSHETLEDVRFVPLIGEQAHEPGRIVRLARARATSSDGAVARLVREAARPIERLDARALEPLIDRVADARVVLLGESTHGTSEFYRARAVITQELIEQRGFSFVAVEADWPDAARVDDYVLGGPRRSTLTHEPFTRFPEWMWRNEEVRAFIESLRDHNRRTPRHKAGFHGLDLYSMFTSIAAVVAYLDGVDRAAAALARERYAGLLRWQPEPEQYAQAVLVGRYQSAEPEVVAVLRELLARRLELARHDGDRFFDAAQNARLVASAERYYRAMYQGAVTSWNLRDSHMFDTLRSLLGYYGPSSKGVVWAHNSHVGNARATEMSDEGEHNLGQLVREAFGDAARAVGFGTDHGSVAAARGWDEPMQVMALSPALAGSYESLFHASELPAFALHLAEPARPALREELLPERLERAIGVVYRVESERHSHYFEASLPRQFDEYVWFDETHAVTPLEQGAPLPWRDLPETFPFGL